MKFGAFQLFKNNNEGRGNNLIGYGKISFSLR